MTGALGDAELVRFERVTCAYGAPRCWSTST